VSDLKKKIAEQQIKDLSTRGKKKYWYSTHW